MVNTPRARQMLAIIARSGQFLPICLTFGPVNGPEDFSYVIDRSFAPGPGAKRRFCVEWLAYVDDLTVEAAHRSRIAVAAIIAGATGHIVEHLQTGLELDC